MNSELEGMLNMRNTYKIEQLQWNENNLHLSLNELLDEKQFQPAGQVLVDSDDYSFIYLIDEGDQYSYLKFSQNVWPQLVELLKSERNPYLQVGEQLIELSNFNDELRTLILNIEGNDNYGNEFVQAVESQFELILKSDVE